MAYPTGQLVVDLRAVADNWKIIQSHLEADVECGAVVKANAYGLGVERIAPKIYVAGCRHFYVANLKEALQLRSLIGLDANAYVLSGCIQGAESTFVERNLIPVIVSMSMFERWSLFASRLGIAPQAVLKVNTGMGRLGIDISEFESLLTDPDQIAHAGINMVMSHFACADEPEHTLNRLQIERFNHLLLQAREAGLKLKATLANSAGVYLGKSAHFDIVRPGIALYGGNPGLKTNPFHRVVSLSLPIIQLRSLLAGEFVGYGATRAFDSKRQIAVVSGGYADGILRSLSNRGWGVVGGVKVPIVGRVSMDSTIFDVTDAPTDVLADPGAAIEILGENISIDDMAQAAGTLGYEVITSLGARYQRCYME